MTFGPRLIYPYWHQLATGADRLRWRWPSAALPTAQQFSRAAEGRAAAASIGDNLKGERQLSLLPKPVQTAGAACTALNLAAGC
jgi:hypothetical protein